MRNLQGDGGEACGSVWTLAGPNINRAICQVALLFERVGSHFCFLSPGWSCWLSQAGVGPFSDLVLLIPCLAIESFGPGELARQVVGDFPAGLEVLGELGWVKTLFL